MRSDTVEKRKFRKGLDNEGVVQHCLSSRLGLQAFSAFYPSPFAQLVRSVK